MSEIIGILVYESFPADAAARMTALAEQCGRAIRWIHLPQDPEARLDAETIGQIGIALYAAGIFGPRGRSFFSAVRKAPNMRWLHVFNAGVDHPVFPAILEAGVRLTTSAGTTAVPIAQTAIGGLLMLARGFPAWLEAQRKHEWSPLRGADQPCDLPGQTLCVLGLGSIGTEIARLGVALGLNVIGIRRSPRRADDPVAEIQTPRALAELLPRCQWLAIACPLTAQTRKLINAEMLARLPSGARIINVARGEIVDEHALIEALRSRHLAGAYLDVFEKEPLPPESPLWDLPNVIISPHSSWAASGNDARIVALFVHNFEQLLRARPMINEVTQAGT
jgi:phosphoglycerate dehydrogenase-like enzyme